MRTNFPRKVFSLQIMRYLNQRYLLDGVRCGDIKFKVSQTFSFKRFEITCNLC